MTEELKPVVFTEETNKHLREQVKDEMAKNERLLRELETAEDRIRDLKDYTKEKLNRWILGIDGELDGNCTTLEAAQKGIRCLKMEKAVEIARVLGLRDENQKLSRELEQAERHIKDLQEGHFTLKRESEARQERRDKLSKGLDSRLQEKHATLQTDLAHMKAFRDILTNEVVELKAAVRNHCQCSNADGAQIEKLKRERSLLRQMLYTGWTNE